MFDLDSLMVGEMQKDGIYMLTNEHKRSLLDLTRMFAYLPFNSIFDFVVCEDHQTLDFFMENIYRYMRNERVGYGPKVDMLLDEIKTVLENSV